MYLESTSAVPLKSVFRDFTLAKEATSDRQAFENVDLQEQTMQEIWSV
jgi:hypothetical protein